MLCSEDEMIFSQKNNIHILPNKINTNSVVNYKYNFFCFTCCCPCMSWAIQIGGEGACSRWVENASGKEGTGNA